MSQEQTQRPQGGEQHQQHHRGEPIKYGDVFNVVGELASKPVMPEDAAMMQTVETIVLGQTQKGGPAAMMQAAATRNERAGLVGHRDMSDVAGVQGMTVREVDVPGAKIISELVGGQVVRQYVEPTPVQHIATVAAVEQSAITIGEALEAAAQSAGSKPVDTSDAAAIQAAEVRATGSNIITPGGLAASAQSAAAHNEQVDRNEDKIKLSSVLRDATAKLPADKVATRQDAEGVMGAELRNNPVVAVQPGGVAASVAAAARINESISP